MTTADQIAIRRAERLGRLIDEYGVARECMRSYLTEYPQGRWALMEADKGSADNGGPWWTVGRDWRKLLEASANQEYPSDWPATTLFDLDSDWETNVLLKYEPEQFPGKLSSAPVVGSR